MVTAGYEYTLPNCPGYESDDTDLEAALDEKAKKEAREIEEMKFKQRFGHAYGQD